MKIFTIVITFTLLFLFPSCQKQLESNDEPIIIDTTVVNNIGNLLIFRGYDLKQMNGITGNTISSIDIRPFDLVEPSVINEDIMYLSTASRLYAVDMKTGSNLFFKNYSPIYLSGTIGLSYPVIKDSIIYRTSHGEANEQVYLYAYNKKSGNKIFQTNINLGQAETSPTLAEPLISGNNIFVIYNGNSSNITPVVSCLNRFTGELKWNKTLQRPFQANPFLNLLNGTLIASVTKGFAGRESIIYGLDTTNGSIKWENQYGTEEYITAEKKVFNNEILSISGSSQNDSKLNFISGTNGTLSSSYLFRSRKFSINGDALFYIDNNRINKYSLSSKSLLWSKDLVAETIRKSASDSATTYVETTNPVVTDKFIYILEGLFSSNAPQKLSSLAVYSRATGDKIHETKNFPNFSFTRFIIKEDSNYFYHHKQD